MVYEFNNIGDSFITLLENKDLLLKKLFEDMEESKMAEGCQCTAVASDEYSTNLVQQAVNSSAEFGK